MLVASLPLLGYLLWHKRTSAMPVVRDWMNSHSWLVDIIVYLVFIALIISVSGQPCSGAGLCALAGVREGD